jgi:hypothetical protein
MQARQRVALAVRSRLDWLIHGLNKTKPGSRRQATERLTHVGIAGRAEQVANAAIRHGTQRAAVIAAMPFQVSLHQAFDFLPLFVAEQTALHEQCRQRRMLAGCPGRASLSKLTVVEKGGLEGQYSKKEVEVRVYRRRWRSAGHGESPLDSNAARRRRTSIRMRLYQPNCDVAR